jgi:hypothetical protein
MHVAGTRSGEGKRLEGIATSPDETPSAQVSEKPTARTGLETQPLSEFGRTHPSARAEHAPCLACTRIHVSEQHRLSAGPFGGHRQPSAPQRPLDGIQMIVAHTSHEDEPTAGGVMVFAEVHYELRHDLVGTAEVDHHHIPKIDDSE